MEIYLAGDNGKRYILQDLYVKGEICNYISQDKHLGKRGGAVR